MKHHLCRILQISITVVLALIVAFPLIWIILSSFKPEGELFNKSLSFFPNIWEKENYVIAWNSAPWGTFFKNTVLVASITVISQLITCSMAGYALSVIKFRGQGLIFLLILAASMIPFEATLLPSYLLVVKLNSLDTIRGIVLPNLTNVLGIFIMRQNFLSIPSQLFEAAEFDHAGTVKMFFRIALPLSKTSLATVALFGFLNSWNSYIWPLVVTTRTDMRTVQIGLSYLIDSDMGTKWAALMAAATFIIIPVLTIFLLLQKYFVAGITHTGIK